MHRFKIVRKDLLIAIQRARNLDDLLQVIKRKYLELKGIPPPPQTVINIASTSPSYKVNFPNAPIQKGPSSDNLSQNLVKCTYCGENIDLNQDMLFCPNCGSPLE